jgi:multicomponent Na+:H+ antiporter subunit E
MVRSFVQRVMLFAMLWLLLSEAIVYSLYLAGLGIAAATVFSLHLWPRQTFRLRWAGLPVLILYFLRSSLKGGVDIGYRALAPSMPLHPSWIRFESTLPNEAGVILLVWMISLMPGTAAVHMEKGVQLTVHVVDDRMYGKDDLRALEGKIAGVIK